MDFEVTKKIWPNVHPKGKFILRKRNGKEKIIKKKATSNGVITKDYIQRSVPTVQAATEVYKVS